MVETHLKERSSNRISLTFLDHPGILPLLSVVGFLRLQREPQKEPMIGINRKPYRSKDQHLDS